MSSFALQEIQAFPNKQASIADGLYATKCTNKGKIVAHDDKVQSLLWFKTPPLDRSTINRIKSVRLTAESHDQGFVDESSAGNWTWLELAIFKDDTARSPRVKDEIELIWESHPNALESRDYTWIEGAVFPEGHDMFLALEEGNVLGVRLCARFPQWSIAARTGYLVIDIGPETATHDAPPPAYKEVLSDVNTYFSTLDAVKLPKTDLVNIHRADVFSLTVNRSLRVLALDGGGVRGLSALHLLKEVMDRAFPGQKPCDVFDMIGGTSTGGLIAIMLGRLKMTVQECIDTYNDLMVDIFKPGKYWRYAINNQFYDDGPLEEAIKKVIRNKLGSDSVDLRDDSDSCKIFVVAVDRNQIDRPVLLRSYDNRQVVPTLPNIKLWEAARATSAAPGYFGPIKVDNYELIDGGLSANNPLGWLWSEITCVYGPNQPINCFLSIGTGVQPPKEFPNPTKTNVLTLKVQSALEDIATNCQDVHLLFRSLINIFVPQRMGSKYWRLTVGEDIPEWNEETGMWHYTYVDPDGVHDLGGLDDVAKIPYLLQMTQRYIEKQKEGFEECVEALKQETKLAL